MDEKTERLREVFMDVTDSDTVTERQVESHGSLIDADESEVAARLEDVIDRMRETYDFGTDLSTAALCAVVRGFYRGDDDATVAADIDADEETVFRARMDLHLIREEDGDAPFDLDRLRDLREEGSTDEAAAALDADPATVERYERVLAARAEARAVSQRFRTEFEEVLADAGLSTRLTEGVQDDGLDEATEDAESDVPM